MSSPLDETNVPTVRQEILARHLHGASRAVVEAGNTAAGNPGDLPWKFLEWDQLPEVLREARRTQARYLLAHFHIEPKERLDEWTERGDELLNRNLGQAPRT